MIDRFAGQYDFLSNFFPAPVYHQGWSFPSVENAYQAAKTEDSEQWKYFLSCTAGQAKRQGKKIQLRKDWEKIKLVIMEDLVRFKFTQHANLRKLLLDTGDEHLVEGNTWNDTFWGVCRGKGKNHLGRILMKVRAELRGTNVLHPGC